MNTKAEIALNDFVERFDGFLVDCAEVERSGKWDTRKNGLMAAFFEADLFAVALQVFERTEAAVLSRMFSAQYTPKQLRDMYRTLKPVIDDYCDEEAGDALAILNDIDPYLAVRYRELILDACEVVSAADGVAEGEERQLIARLRRALSDR